MVRSNSYKIIKFSQKSKNASLLDLTYKPILTNQALNVHDRSFIYGYSRNFFRSFKSKYKSTCLFSGRNRGVFSSFHISRITFKKFAITGVLSGFKKSRW
jgi:ribosomal protein S14